SSLEQSAASLEEITGTVKNNSINAHEASSMAEATRQRARESEELVKQTIEAMKQICQSSNKISDITGVIDEIAFQTNLLALNAAVEAAHAGDQGKGFAVVASEVRELAQRSSEAAKEIKLLIEESGKKVMSGTQLVNHSGEALREIIEDVNAVAKQISQITQAGDEQTIGIEMINRSINEIDAVTQQNKALGQQTANASRDLCAKSRDLANLVDFFRAERDDNVVNIHAA
ncbi:MAG TPA: methyl-accepting chemotaxis protein, partial [Gammaproteobacteria bacterium]|nr:methyl-accepting chemotaxis protein [Gammaproteobacteria bacterium]